MSWAAAIDYSTILNEIAHDKALHRTSTLSDITLPTPCNIPWYMPWSTWDIPREMLAWDIPWDDTSRGMSHKPPTITPQKHSFGPSAAQIAKYITLNDT